MSNSITINLNVFERQFLLFLSQRRVVDMNHNKIHKDVISALDNLEKKGAITKNQLIGSGNSFEYKLSPIGANLVDLIKEN